MVVHMGEPEVRHGGVLETLEYFISRCLSGLETIQEFFGLSSGHGGTVTQGVGGSKRENPLEATATATARTRFQGPRRAAIPIWWMWAWFWGATARCEGFRLASGWDSGIRGGDATDPP